MSWRICARPVVALLQGLRLALEKLHYSTANLLMQHSRRFVIDSDLVRAWHFAASNRDLSTFPPHDTHLDALTTCCIPREYSCNSLSMLARTA